MGTRTFTVTENHIKLLKAAYVSWLNFEFGAPGIDYKKPYGNSIQVLEDIATIIGLELFENQDGVKHLNTEQAELCQRLHREMEYTLQILLSNCCIEPGLYEREQYGNIWRKKD